MEVEKKNGKGSIVVIVFLLILVIALGSYIGYDKFLSKDNTETSTTEENSKNKTNAESELESIEENVNENDDSKQYCEGTYYGEASGNLPNGLTYNYKYTYTLNSDGTFTANISDIQKQSGTYLITEDTITFIYHKETYGGSNSNSYTSTSRYISSDCSYMMYDEEGISFKIAKNSHN